MVASLATPNMSMVGASDLPYTLVIAPDYQDIPSLLVRGTPTVAHGRFAWEPGQPFPRRDRRTIDRTAMIGGHHHSRSTTVITLTTRGNSGREWLVTIHNRDFAGRVLQSHRLRDFHAHRAVAANAYAHPAAMAALEQNKRVELYCTGWKPEVVVP